MTSSDIPTLAEYAVSHYYNSAEETKALRDWAAETEALDISDAIYEDIRDLLHNGNVEDIFDISNLTDDEVDALSTRFHDGWSHDHDELADLADAIAAILNTQYPN